MRPERIEHVKYVGDKKSGLSEDKSDRPYNPIGDNITILCKYGSEQPQRTRVLLKAYNNKTSHVKRKTDKQWLL